MKQMPMFGIAIILIFLIAIPQAAFSRQSDKILPKWVKNPPQALNNSYYFKVIETDGGETLTTARKHSQKELTRNIAREFSIKVSDKLESKHIEQYYNKQIQYSGKEVYTLNIESDDGNVQLFYEVVDEYYRTEKINGYAVFKLYTLYAVARPNIINPQFDNFIKTDKYGFDGAWRSILIPSWGQFYKGDYLKGGLIIGGSVAITSGIIVTESLRLDYIQKMQQTYNTQDIRYYSNQANTMQIVRNVCIGGIIAMYLYNVIDAAVASGARRVKVSRIKFGTYSNNNEEGIKLTYTF